MPRNVATLFLRGIPRNVRDNFKSYCAKRGTNMTAEIIHFMKKMVEKDKKDELEVRWARKGGF